MTVAWKNKSQGLMEERYPLLRERLEDLKREHRYRSLRRVESEQAAHILMDGNTVRLFCSNNYLGLANHPRVKEAAAEAARSCGCGSGASRLISGNMRLHEELEERIARFMDNSSVILFNNGYTANVGILSSLMSEGDTIFSDTLNHASIIDGCRLSRARIRVYRHGDPSHLESLLKQDHGPGRRMIVTDSLFSMDGDLAPLPDLAGLARTHGCLLMVDEAHAVGVLGPNGRGAAERFGVEDAVDLSVGTMGKALGSFGAFATCSPVVRDYLINHARSLIYSTSLPPPMLAAAAAALEIVRSEPERRDRLQENAHRFGCGLREMGFSVPEPRTHIQALITGPEKRTMALSESLLRQGVFAQGIRPPTVPPGTSRIRFSLMATHTNEDIDIALKAVRNALTESNAL
jgi:8-amino-7-oxononanoate synthase